MSGVDASSQSPSDELRKRVVAMAGLASGPPRARVRRRRASIVGLGAALSLAVFGALGGMHLGDRSPGMLAASAAGWALVAAAATWVGFGAGRGMLGPPRSVLGVVVLFVAPALAAWSQIFVEAPATAGVVSERLHVTCFAFTLVYSAVPLAAMLALRQKSDPVHPRALGALLGAAAGAWGSVLIDLHCPVVATAHVLLSHVLPVIALAALGACFASFLAPRAEPATK
jgi:hypothetical protein